MCAESQPRGTDSASFDKLVYLPNPSIQKRINYKRVIPPMVFMRSDFSRKISKTPGTRPSVRLLVILSVSSIVILLAAVSGAVLKGSSNMCAGCHGNRYREFSNLLPQDPLSVLPTEFDKGNGTAVKIAVEILDTGDPGAQSYFRIDILRVTLSSTGGKVSIPTPQQQKNNLYPDDKTVFEWTVTGQSRGQDTLRFDLYAHNPHQSCSTSDVYSYGITVTSTAEPPGEPGNLEASPGNGFVMLSWEEPVTDGGESITGYEIYRGGTPGSGIQITTVPANTLEYNDTSVTNGMDYYYTVKAVNSEGKSLPSSEVSARPVGPPSAPRNMRGSGGNSFVELSWDPPSDNGGTPVLQYILRRSTGGSAAVAIATLDSPHTSYNDTNVTNGVEFRYSVTAVNSRGESAPGTSVTVTPQADATVPGAPVKVNAIAGDGHVLITWEPPLQNGGSPITGYRIYVAPFHGNLSLIADLPASQLSFGHYGVVSGVNYSFIVTAINPLGESTPSEMVHATPRGVPTEPGAPEAIAGRKHILLAWSFPGNDGGSPIIGWSILRGPSPDELEEEYRIDNYGSIFNDSNVTCGLVYHYAIAAWNYLGRGPQSSAVNATPGLPASSPVDVRAIAGRGLIEVLWEEPGNDGGCPVTGYDLFRREAQNEPIRIDVLGPESRYAKDMNVIAGTRYFYSIRAVTAMGNGTSSDEVEVTASDDDIPEIPELKFASIYPGGETIDAEIGRVLVLSASPDRVANISWYVDGNLYAAGIKTLTYPVIDAKEHTITVEAVDAGSSDSTEHSWTVNTGEEPALVTGERDGAGGQRGFIRFVIWGGLLFLAALAVLLILYYGKRSG